MTFLIYSFKVREHNTAMFVKVLQLVAILDAPKLFFDAPKIFLTDRLVGIVVH